MKRAGRRPSLPGTSCVAPAARLVLATVAAACLVRAGSAQTRTPQAPVKKPAPPAPTLTKLVPQTTCPAPLGIGVKTKLAFCEVLAGRDPLGGILVKIPPHRGPVTLTFDLHNLHVYSDDLVKAKRAFTRYTASIGVLTMDNTLIARAVVQNEFRSAADLVDRVGGGAGPGGVKAVAPTGTESIVVAIPESEDQVSLLGEKLTVEGMTAPPATFSQEGRPIATVSNLMVEYRPAPPKPATPAKPTKKGGGGGK
jgi:hypothetical protein